MAQPVKTYQSVRVKRINKIYRLVDSSTGDIAKNPDGSPRDNGGFDTNPEAKERAKQVNQSLVNG